MGQIAEAEQTFAEWLRGQLKERGWGVRTLARKIDPANPEVPRRALNRYMQGARPSDAYIDAIAKALDVEVGELPLVKEAAPSGDTFRGGDRRTDHPSDRDGRGTSAGAPGDVKDAA